MDAVPKGMISGGYIARAQSTEWLTPPPLLDWLEERFGPFNLDPSPYPRPEGFDGLAIEWTGKVFCNPPFGNGIREWMKKGYEASLGGTVVVFLVPARTDVRWFHEFAVKGRIEFIRGRVPFSRPDGSSAPAPFPSMLVIFRRVIEPTMTVCEWRP